MHTLTLLFTMIHVTLPGLVLCTWLRCVENQFENNVLHFSRHTTLRCTHTVHGEMMGLAILCQTCWVVV